jgi:hypothetical protein
MTIADVAFTVAHRLRDNYIGRDRGAEYSVLLRSARDAGYDLIPLAEFYARERSPDRAVQKLLVLRHDVDIRDVAGNERFRSIERAIGARSTFYFRRSTAAAHRRLIGDLLRDGFEVGYHFEEAAVLAKQQGLGCRSQVFGQRPAIEELFRRNCAKFRRRWNPDLVSVASHGDWINRRLGFENHEPLSPGLLAECGLLFEAYGDDIVGRADVYVSDVARSPARWAGDYGLAEALREARDPICVLTHERNWFTNRRANAEADLDRLADGFRYRLRRGRAAP